MVSATGSTSAGFPLSLNRAPIEALQPWISRLGVTSVTVPSGQSITCGTFGESPIVRIIFGSRWSADTADGTRHFVPGEDGLVLYFGSCTKRMKLTAHGSFRVFSINFAPGGSGAVGLPSVEDTNDRILPLPVSGGDFLAGTDFTPDDDVTLWLDRTEQTLAAELSQANLYTPDPLLSEFEGLCLTEPRSSLDEFAEKNGMTRRTLERIIHRAFGVSPGFAMRRARALDMASALLDIGNKGDEEELALRYYDQSHLTREMKKFFGMTPGQLKKGAHPLLLITMEIRQSRRLELLQRIQTGGPRPWRDPDAEPA